MTFTCKNCEADYDDDDEHAEFPDLCFECGEEYRHRFNDESDD